MTTINDNYEPFFYDLTGYEKSIYPKFMEDRDRAKVIPIHRVRAKVDSTKPDSMSLLQLSPGKYRERLTLFEIIGKYEEVDAVHFHPADVPKNWRVRFPRTEIEVPVESFDDGKRLLWEFREALKDVLERYHVTRRDLATGKLRTFLTDPYGLTVRKRKRQPNVYDPFREQMVGHNCPHYLACI